MYHGERLNSATHLLGLALALVGMPALISRALRSGSIRSVIGVSVFGVTIILLYACSSAYHSMRGAKKDLWAKADHCAIYLLIAGTYTPFTLVTLRGAMGWGLLTFEWGLAGIGICKELLWRRATAPSVPLYLLMGWGGVVAASSLMQGLRNQGWIWLLTGAMLYTVGIVFYALDNRIRHAHGIWHLFVLAGTASHYVTVFRFVA